MTVETLLPDTAGADLRIGIVQSRFNEPICVALRKACVTELLTLGVLAEDILIATVPGALEIPFALQKMAESQQFDALIALGAVIRGETYHFELVSNESAAGISKVALGFDIPVANGVLTTEDDAQAEARADGKGRDAASAAIEMANLAARLEDLAGGDDEDPQ
jgi:6,7-dimethyl-8-ribityllumazine synthase